ncbi:hypothetical protein [Timonella sp. A28]|uniref:hypothetical protein n=1 Tax=Timonella sp. A28 TaxID=3442640 RepID=UPI003EBED2E0
MTGVTGPSLWPGMSLLDEQLGIFETFSSAPYGVEGIPFFAVLGSHTPWGDELGRTLALLDQVPVELGPHGWKMADRPGLDEQRVNQQLALDLEALSIAASGYDGDINIHVMGPWTLSALLYLARGDRALTDMGAVRELAQSLTAGVHNFCGELKKLLPRTRVQVTVNEKLIGQIAAGVLPTFSGYSRISRVSGPTLVEQSTPFYESLTSAGIPVTVHVGDAWVGIAPTVLSGATRLAMDFGRTQSWNEQGWSAIARAVERGVGFSMGVPAPAVSQCAGPDLRALADTLLVPWQRIGLEQKRLSEVVLTLGESAAQEAYRHGTQHARGTLATVFRVAEYVAEKAAQ